jgi:hypothetical protein
MADAIQDLAKDNEKKTRTIAVLTLMLLVMRWEHGSNRKKKVE